MKQMGVLKKKKSPNWSIRQKTGKAEHSLRRQPQICCGLTLELNGSVTCNDFFTCGSVTWRCLRTPMYALMAAEEQSVTAWHLCSCDIIEMLIWQRTNYESWQDNTGKHSALPVYLTWPFPMNGRSSDVCPLLWCPLLLFSSFYS